MAPTISIRLRLETVHVIGGLQAVDSYLQDIRRERSDGSGDLVSGENDEIPNRR